jgi:hypothetical protein
MSSATRSVAEKLSQLVSSGLVEVAGEGMPLPNGGRSWSVSWKDFNSGMANFTFQSVNSPPGNTPVPYTLIDFHQTFLDDSGKHMTKFVFSLESEARLLDWLQSLLSN